MQGTHHIIGELPAEVPAPLQQSEIAWQKSDSPPMVVRVTESTTLSYFGVLF